MTPDALRELIDSPATRLEVSAVDMTEAFLEAIGRDQPSVNAYITVTPELALADARRADQARSTGRRLRLDGMAIAVKDNIDVGGVKTTVGSQFFRNRVADEDSYVIRKLRAAGAVILGKLALHEFVYGGTTNNPFYGPTRNPWNLERVPGGSSGGSGAALAADLCIGALGSDTGGSIRIPAALTGVAGLRPTYGSISNRGAFPIAWSFDTVGPMARGVADVASLFDVMVGFDSADPRAIPPIDPDPHFRKDKGVKGLRIGLPVPYFFDSAQPAIVKRVRGAVDVFTDLGCAVVEFSLPAAAQANEACTVISRVDAFALHRTRCSENPELFGEDTLRRLRLGSEISAADYAAGVQFMYEWRRQLKDVFRDFDVLITPTVLEIAPLIEGTETIAATARLARLTQPWSLAGIPALSLPCGPAAEGMPSGLQLATAPWNDAMLLGVGASYQEVTEWHRRRPSLT